MALTLSSTIRLSSGFHMPLLGLGVYQNPDAKASVLEAFKAGYRHVDSAQGYRNEAAVGEAVRASGLKREDLFITTKCATPRGIKTTTNRTPDVNLYDSTLKGVDASLAKFGFDYIDLFLIHDPFSGTEGRVAMYKALLDAKAAGKIRSVGVSNFSVPHLEELVAHGLEMPAVNQIELHPLCQQKPIVDFCKKKSIVVQAYCPIIRGQKMDHDVIQKIATKYNRDPAQILLRWSLQKGFVPLPKSSNPGRIQSNAQLYDFELNAEEMSNLDVLDLGDKGGISWNPVNASLPTATQS
ncbi:NADP-dependent oxidoreductase domain-containing protein [Mycena epipterygia]|nr:NADP-dependent oxidoreductase domain-containing protein [Mycena epipterygia]